MDQTTNSKLPIIFEALSLSGASKAPTLAEVLKELPEATEGEQ